MTLIKSGSRSVLFRQLLSHLLDGVFLSSVLFVPFMWFLSIWYLTDSITLTWKKVYILLPFFVFGLRTWLISSFRKKGIKIYSVWDEDLTKKMVLALSVIFFALVACEQMLKVLDFEAKTPPIIIKGEDNQAVGQYGMIRDPVLVWKFSPNGEFKAWKINRFGFKDRPILKEKPPGTVRVINFGDSCTADGGPPYSGCLHQLLRDNPPGGHSWDAFNMGVYGYSSVQGLRYYNLVGREFDPDIVTLYFGWNDHWISGYRPDSHNLGLKMDKLSGKIAQRFLDKRIGQLAFRFLSPKESSMSIKMQDGDYPGDIEQYLRVPQDEFRYTMGVFIDQVRADGALPIVITPPNGPSYSMALVHNGQAESLEQLAQTHKNYTEIIRAVAAEKNCALLDLATIMSGEEDYDLFNKDGIHLTQKGLWRIADEIYAKICEVIEGEEWRSLREK